MGKPTICIGENKGANQLRGNRQADQRLCFRYSDSTIPLLLESEISSFLLFSVLVQPGLCRTCSETTLLVFPRGGSNVSSKSRSGCLSPYISMILTVQIGATSQNGCDKNNGDLKPDQLGNNLHRHVHYQNLVSDHHTP